MEHEPHTEPAASGDPSDAERRAIDAALNFLSYRPRTGREVRRKLAERGFSEGTIQAAMERLGAVGLVDDEAFIGAFVRDRIAHRPMGVRRMAQELYIKGVPREVALPVIERVLATEETSERALAERVVAKRLRAPPRSPAELAIFRRRLRDHLVRRGFDLAVVQGVLEAAFTAGGAIEDGEVGGV